MNETARLFAATALLTGCNGANWGIWGNLLVVGITVGIFVMTLSIKRAVTLTRSRRSSSGTQPAPSETPPK